MRQIVMAGLALMLSVAIQAQSYKTGEKIEFNKHLADEGSFSWVTGKVIKVDTIERVYTVRGSGSGTYQIPFGKEDRWMRRAMEPLNTTIAATAVKLVKPQCEPTEDVLRQKISDEFNSDFSEYDTVQITYNNLEVLTAYANKDQRFAKEGTLIHPYNVDFTVRLVSRNSDGTQRKINWQFKRKYLLFQNNKGSCTLTIAEKDDELLSHI